MTRLKNDTNWQSGFTFAEALIAIALITVIGIVSAVAYQNAHKLGGVTSQSCEQRRENVTTNLAPDKVLLQTTKIVSGVMPTAITQSVGGDCVDSLPNATAEESYEVNLGAGALLADINTNLTAQGFTKSKANDFDLSINSCSQVLGSVYYTKGAADIRINLTEPTGKVISPDCEGSSSVSQASFDAHVIHTVTASVSNRE